MLFRLILLTFYVLVSSFALANYDINTLISNGKIHLKNKDYNSAIKSFEEALVLESNSIDAYYNLGIIYRELNETKLSLSNFYKIYKINQSNKHIFYETAKTYFHSGMFKLALKELEYYLESNPFDAEAVFLKSKCYLKLNKLSEALKLAKLALEYNYDPKLTGDIYELKSIIYFKLKNKKSACESLKRGFDEGKTELLDLMFEHCLNKH